MIVVFLVGCVVVGILAVHVFTVEPQRKEQR